MKEVFKIELKPDNISIDMIELAINIEPEEFTRKVEPYLKTFRLDLCLKYWDNFYWKGYRHNWTWETDEYTIYLAYKSNSGNKDSSNKFKIKFNPNKVDSEDKFLKVMLNVFKYTKESPFITWFDVAFDYLGITTSDVIFDKGRKREYKIFKYPDSDYTYYLGKSGSNGSIKIYDKANEELEGQADYNKTRLEVTVRDNISFYDVDSWKCIVDMPKLFIRQIRGLYDNKKLSPTEKLLIYSVDEGYPMEKLTYRQRIRYREITQDRKEIYTEIMPSQVQIEKAIQNFVVDWLN